MVITREMLIKKLSSVSGYYQQDIKKVLQCLDKVVLECFGEVTDDEDIIVQLVKGVRISAHIVPKRERVDPRTGEPIICQETVKPACKFSDDFRRQIQENYEAQKNG